LTTRIATLVVFLLCAGSVLAATPEENYRKRWAQLTVNFADPAVLTSKPGLTCVCQDGGTYDTKLGTMARFGDDAFCSVPLFGPGGVIDALAACYVYTSLGR